MQSRTSLAYCTYSAHDALNFSWHKWMSNYRPLCNRDE